LDSLGWVYYRLHQFDKAERYLKMSLALQATYVQHEHLGDVYWAEKRKIDAAKEWNEALGMIEPGWKRLKEAIDSGEVKGMTNETPPDIIRLRNKLKDAH